MKTDELIQALAREARPVRPLTSPTRLAAALALCAVAASVLGVWLLGTRPDLAERLFERRFLTINILLLLTLGAAALALGALAVPGRRRFKAQIAVGLVLVSVIMGLILLRRPWFHGIAWGFWFTLGAYCTVRTLLLGALPAAVGFWMHRHGAPMYPAVSGGLIGGAAGSQGANAMGWACEIDEPMHVLVWHLLLPSAVLALLGVFAGRRWLRW